jgi:hypothetical protein
MGQHGRYRGDSRWVASRPSFMAKFFPFFCFFEEGAWYPPNEASVACGTVLDECLVPLLNAPGLTYSESISESLLESL